MIRLQNILREKMFFVALSLLSKILILSTARGLGHPHLFILAFFVLGHYPYFIALGVFWLRYHVLENCTNYIKDKMYRILVVTIATCSCGSELLYSKCIMATEYYLVPVN